MSLFKRMTNLAKGTLATAGPERGSDALETLLKEQALEDELARAPAPSDAAREALRDLKAGRGAAPAQPSSGQASLGVEIERLKKAHKEGVLTDEELERKTAEATARSEADRASDLPPPERPITKTL